MPKTVNIENGKYHLVVHVCLFNSKGEMLLQKRVMSKPLWPGMWDFSAGGAALAGERSHEAAERELFEELSIHIPLSEYRPILTVHFDDGFDDYYVVNIDDEQMGEICFQGEEIDEIRWCTYEDVVKLIKKGEMDIVPSFVGVLFAMREKRGNHL